MDGCRKRAKGHILAIKDVVALGCSGMTVSADWLTVFQWQTCDCNEMLQKAVVFIYLSNEYIPLRLLGSVRL